MANSSIDIKEDASPTKKLASQTFTRGIDTVHQEEITIGDGATDGRVVAVTAANALKVDGSAVNQPVTDAGGALTVDAIDLDIRNLATGQDKVDARLRNAADSTFIEPATDRATAAAPASARLSDGAAFYKATTPTDTQPVSIAATVTVQDANLDNATLVDNAAFTDGTTRVAMGGYIFDETAGVALTENDAAAARVDSKRAQVAVLEDATTRGQRQGVLVSGAAKVDVASVAGTVPTTAGKLDVKGADGDVFVRQATAVNLNAQVVGEVAHDAADSGNPQKIGAQARQTNPTAVADADRVNITADDVGRQVVRVGQVRDLMADATTTITTATETTILAAVASTFLDLVTLIIANTSATGVRVDIRDATAGSVVLSLYCPATQTVGFTLTRPKNQTTVNNNWTAQSSSAVTDLRVYIQAEKNV